MAGLLLALADRRHEVRSDPITLGRERAPGKYVNNPQGALHIQHTAAGDIEPVHCSQWPIWNIPHLKTPQYRALHSAMVLFRGRRTVGRHAEVPADTSLGGRPT
jgi:hypothetical protein